MNSFTIGIIGNPNCGKTSLFNILTGSNQHVGNWPGVTVEKKTGTYIYAHKKIKVVDLPGTYSLDYIGNQVSLDEKIALDYIFSRQANLIVNIIDASNIERNLYLTSQLIEMRVPMLLVLNMMDVVKQRGIKIDSNLLAEKLSCPVVTTIAITGIGIDQLQDAINQSCTNTPIPHRNIKYSPALEQASAILVPLLTKLANNNQCDAFWLALRLLEADTLATKIVSAADTNNKIMQTAKQLQKTVEDTTNDEIDILTADARYSFVHKLTQQSVCRLNEISSHTSDKIDKIVLNRLLGIPIFLFVIYAMFMFTINIGSAFVDFFDLVAGAIFVNGLKFFLILLDTPEWLIALVADGLGGGVQVVATFIPIVGFLFIFLSALEDSGYMSRAAFVVDRLMVSLGLPGKSFVPMIIGFGCNVPAIMATRTLEKQSDRILTNLMNPFISCGARLPVYALFATAFFPVGGQNLVFSLYLLGIIVAILTGLIMRYTLFKGEVSPFIMELPAYHMPTLKSVYLKTWDRLRIFIFNAGKVIVPMVLVLNFLNTIGTDGSFGQENSQKSVLSEIGRSLTTVFKPMGIKAENWPATVGIFTGVLAKEAVVGTLDALYSQTSSTASQNSEFNLFQELLDAWTTIPQNLFAISNNILDPLGLNIGDISNINTAATEQEVTSTTFLAMQASFDGQAGAFAYLLFILLYAPCVAATTAVYRETNAKWAIFVVFWTTGLGYMTATIFYQIATFLQHPLYSTLWILGLFVSFAVVIFALWYYGNFLNKIKN